MLNVQTVHKFPVFAVKLATAGVLVTTNIVHDLFTPELIECEVDTPNGKTNCDDSIVSVFR